jgi:hypothetical protein
MSTVLEGDETSERLRLFDGSAGTWVRLPKLAAEMHWAADALAVIASPKVRKIRTDSPNPQVRFAMYLVGWIEHGTGRQHYEDLTELIEAAFAAAGKHPPRWVGRLAVEMNYKRRLRKNWAKTLLVPS